MAEQTKNRPFILRMLASPRRRGALAGVFIMGAAMGFAAAAQQEPAGSAAGEKTAAEVAVSPAPAFTALR